MVQLGLSDKNIWFVETRNFASLQVYLFFLVLFVALILLTSITAIAFIDTVSLS